MSLYAKENGGLIHIDGLCLEGVKLVKRMFYGIITIKHITKDGTYSLKALGIKDKFKSEVHFIS